MRPFALLKCIAQAAVKVIGNLAGFPYGSAALALAEGALKEWKKEKAEAARKAELEAIVKMAGDEFNKQVQAVVKQVAGNKPPAVQQQITAFLERIPEQARKKFARPDDEKGLTVPPGFHLAQPSDLLPFLYAEPIESLPNEIDFAQVSLRYTNGALAGQEATYTEPAVLLLGRAEGCDPKLPENESHRQVSRRHCFVEVNPPDVRIRDLGSRNGTYVNGNLIGKRPEGTEPDPAYESPDHPLSDGAEIYLSDKRQVAFTVRILSQSQPSIQECAWCNRTVTEPGTSRTGMFVCADCRGNVERMVRGMVDRSRGEETGLKAVKDYDLLEELGHGGMGAVWLARHRKTKEPAAVKVMLPKVAANERAVELFQREVRNSMVLRHRNVVRLLDHGFSRGAFFLVLEYCDGGSVDRLMTQRGGQLPVDEAVEIALQALEGLEYAHNVEVPFVRQKAGGYGPGRGLIHRDVKPANLFLSGWGSGRVVKVGDYGLAKGFEEAGLSGGTRTGDVAGTWQFMCRKQVIGYKNAAPEVDVWSLAASLYQMLTGQLPRDFPDSRDPWLVVLEDDPVQILKRNPKLTRPLAELIDHALREEPEMSFKTAAEFKRALEKVV